MIITSFIKKYIPKNIKDINIDENDKLFIQNMISSKNVYNLVILGNSGTGKSALSNIILNEYYKDIKDKNSIKNNTLIVDILLEDGISFYKNDVKNFCNTSSYIKNYKKVLIIDYIDIISEQSQLIIKNYIEEYSNNVLFLLILYDINKINNSIFSNCDIINIKNSDYLFLEKLLKKINIAENLNIDESLYYNIIFKSKYNIPCLVNNLQKIKLTGNIDDFTNINDYDIYLEYCKNLDYKNSTDFILNIHNNGTSIIDILYQLNLYLKLAKIDTEIKYKLIKFTIEYINKCYNNNDDKIDLFYITNNYISIFI